MEALIELHDNIMFYLVIILFGVAWILISIIRNYVNDKSPISNKYLNHGTLIELIWTITPALILILIAFPSFKLLYLMDEVTDPCLTVFVEGHQWYWSYQYPDFLSSTFFFLFIPLLAIVLLGVNLILAPHNPYEEKNSVFECGFHSFLGQNRSEFSISFFIFALLFLLFDLEILLVYPYIVSSYVNGIFGLIVVLIFFLVLTLGFVFELGKNALSIESRQIYSVK